MTARRMIPVAAAGALVLLAPACGTTAPATDLQIRVHDYRGARTYRLSCDPAGGTVPDPLAACRALAARRGLLAGGIGFDHTCPSAPWTEVVGSSRGRAVSAVFSACRDVPGQASPGAWLELVDYQSTGGNPFGRASSNAPLQTAADRSRAARRRRALQRRVVALVREEQRLRRLREAELRTGRLSLEAATRPDPLTRRILRLDALASATRGGYPHPQARLYVGGTKGRPRFFVAVAVGADELSMAYDATGLTPTAWSIGPRRPARSRGVPLLS
jgi:hypothetical protein